MTSSQPSTEQLTVDVTLSHAARLLHHAEGETNLQLAERLESLADSWVSIACLLNERDRL